ncbi:MAG: HAMP domain-containing sensor histidine kinase [Desulfuromonadaceae bacterium]|nr:HAMP domain-containing sensor histidine kinase [Desulfuromonadaceae bacterium]MDD2849296.1 HAMP domain-containing sensor histidine kinase [Desulfuromonadaceae bacterium]MDD4131923.1 HAMP domain-containing sensor histidine kinase [Desulfuromonadaceae bacterium]
MIRSLYLKILLHWVVTLIITEALIFGLFTLVVGDSHRRYVITSVGQSTVVARDFVQAAVAADIAKGGVPTDALDAAVRRLSASINAKVWITNPNGKPVAASFPGKAPTPITNPKRSGQHDGVVVSVEVSRDAPWYAVVPVAVPAEGSKTLMLHLLSTRTAGAFPSGAFAAGLALIGALVALLAVPLSLRITKPLNRLQESALRIAGGDLTTRAEISERDEIGRLAAAFNTMAETVERMVRGGKELTANISHELRSPLARIRVAGECLKDAVDKGNKEETDEMLEAMWEDVEEVDRMIARILEFSKLDLHEPLAVAEEIAPAKLIRALIKTVGPMAKTKNINFEADLLYEEHVIGDEEWLRTAFKNLMENAVRHTEDGGDVHVAMRREDTSLVFEITNSHQQIEPRELELIFNPFYRVKENTGEGTGLGLAITRRIITLHHGEIGARNVPKGFQVWIALPLKKV